MQSGKDIQVKTKIRVLETPNRYAVEAVAENLKRWTYGENFLSDYGRIILDLMNAGF